MTCSFEGCDRAPRSRREPLCEGHYYQRRRGRELSPLMQRVGGAECSAEGCDKPRGRARYCSMHGARLRRHGDLDRVVAPEERMVRRLDDHPRWTEEPTYEAVHQRVKAARGPAREHSCAECGGPAAQWSYVGPREPGQRRPYSADVDDYLPRCVPCHKAADMAEIRESMPL